MQFDKNKLKTYIDALAPTCRDRQLFWSTAKEKGWGTAFLKLRNTSGINETWLLPAHEQVMFAIQQGVDPRSV